MKFPKPIRPKKKPKKLRKKSLRKMSRLMDIAVTTFNRWIRNRDAVRLNGKCYTCGATGTEAGHFIQSIGLLRFNETAVNLQCTRCNRYLSGNQAAYTLRLINDYDLDTVQALHRAKSIYVKYSRQMLEDIIKKYERTS
jgi:hypothetical protein